MDSPRNLIYNTEQARNQSFFPQPTPTRDPNPLKCFTNIPSVKNFERYDVIVDNEHLQREMKLIEWRSKTELPLVKVLFYKILQKRLLNQCSVVQMAIQNFIYSLYTLPKMGFYQILYLLKESLIGFQALFERFGSFEVTDKMVLINKNSKCKVWVNQNITLNFPTKRTNLSQNQFLVKILKLFEEKCIRSILMIDLFEKMSNLDKLIHAIQYLQTYIRGNGIILADKLNINTEAFNPIRLNTPTKNEEKQKSNFRHSKIEYLEGSQVKKIPKFIQSRRQQTSIDYLAIKNGSRIKNPERRNTSINKAINKSLSLRDIKNVNTSQRRPNDSSISKKIERQNSLSDKINSRTSLGNLIKQNSQTHLNPFESMTSRKTIGPYKRLFNQRKFQEQQANNPIQQSKIKNTYLRGQFQNTDKYHASSARDLCSINSSQQTDTTINSSLVASQQEIKEKEETQKNHHELQESLSIFEKNGWTRRVNNLTEDFQYNRQMIQSHHQGTQTLSEDISFAGERLTLLESMGKSIQSSQIQQIHP